jgi:hypothetical protein
VGLDPESRPALVHIDDVTVRFNIAVDTCLLFLERGYRAFDLVTSQESMWAREMGLGGA